MGFRLVVTFFFVVFLCLIPLSYALPCGPADERNMKKTSSTASYVSHDSIIIFSNQDYATQGWPSEGTEEDPYIIAGLNITSNETCIFISGTTVHFIIRDCLISFSDTA